MREYYIEKPNVSIKLECIGEICKKHREKLRITQKQIAKETGYTQAMISLFEKGKLNNAYILSWYIEMGVII